MFMFRAGGQIYTHSQPPAHKSKARTRFYVGLYCALAVLRFVWFHGYGARWELNPHLQRG